jgi:gas vesicle protein
MAMSKSQVGLGVVVVIGAAAIIFLQYQTGQKLRAENESLRQQIASLKSDSPDTPTANSQPTGEDRDELLRLRGEVSALRSQTNQIPRLEKQNQQLQEAVTAAVQERQRAPASTPEADQLRTFGILQLNTSRQYMLGMINYANDHQGQFPTNFDQMSSYFQNSGLATNMNRFEMVYTGTYSTIANPSSAIVVREIQPWMGSGKWHRTYSFADGHSEVHSEDALNNFDAWEQQHVPVLNNQ